MTVDNEVDRNDATGNGVQVTFNYTFRILDEEEILVTVTTSAGVESTKTLTTDYSVTGVGNANGGTVVFVTAPANLSTVTLSRNMEFVQPLDVSEQSSFSLTSLETALDRTVMQIQQVKESTDRCMRLPVGTDPDDVDVELPTPSASKFLAWNADADALENISAGSVSLATPADNSVSTAKIQNSAVTLAKIEDIETARILGRDTSGTGAVEKLTAAEVLALLAITPDASTVESSGTTLRVKDAGITAAKLNAAVVSGMTAETAIATTDLLVIGDVSAANVRKMLVTDFLKVINLLTADATPDNAADYVMTWDNSASAVKKVLISNLATSLPQASTSAAGIIEIATASEVQTGTDSARAVVPARMRDHQGVGKGWCKFEQVGTISVMDSYNVTSITDSGVGATTVTWDTNFGNADYAAVATVDAGGTSGYATIDQGTVAAGSCVVEVFDAGGAALDSAGVSVVGFGDN